MPQIFFGLPHEAIVCARGGTRLSCGTSKSRKERTKMNRRDFHRGAGAALAACIPAWAAAVQAREGDAPAPWDALERRCGGRLGVAVLKPRGALLGHRLGERFPMCSTFKWVLAAQVLQRVDRGEERLERRVTYGRDALVAYSPVTREHLGRGMTVAQLCEAAVAQSDNGAANLLLAASGGPAAVTAFARGCGDTVTRLDRKEPELNEGEPGDVRDTTSPVAMARLLHSVLTGNALSQAARGQLARWMEGSQTNANRLRTGLPPGWRMGSKTGTGARGSTNDVGFFHAPVGGLSVVAVYITGSAAPLAQREATIAAVAAALTRGTI
jgi:beta-lactamase class A